MAVERADSLDAAALRVLTWNLHGCVGRDGRFDPERIARVLLRADPDIAALQEVDARCRVAGGLDTFDFLRERTGHHALEARTLTGASGDYGHMVVSRWPFSDARVHDISVPGREVRKAIEFEVTSPFGTLWGLALHMGLRRGERQRQRSALAAVVGRGSRRAGIILGDLNEPLRRVASRAFAPGFRMVPPQPTFPAAWPLLALDGVWHVDAFRMRRHAILRHARDASDHLPLVVDFDSPEGACYRDVAFSSHPVRTVRHE